MFAGKEDYGTLSSGYTRATRYYCGMGAEKPARKLDKSWAARRKKALALFDVGIRQSDVARLLKVSRQCVHNWFWQWQGHDGKPRDGRRSASGRKPKLTAEQLADVDAALRKGPREFGYGSDRWTLWRIAELIERLTGIQYHPSSVWRILRTLGWTLKLPPRREEPARRYVPREWAAPKPSADGQS